MQRYIPIYHSLKFKIIVIAFIVVMIIIGLLLFKSHRDQVEMIKMQEENLNQIAVDTIYRRFKVSYQILEVGVTQILANPSVKEAFAERDREKLLNLVSGPYKKLKDVGVTQFHFHLPDSRSFLRVHKPKEYGDYLDFRKTVATINEDDKHKAIKGLEEGIHGLSLRHIQPIYYKSQYIGSIELGMELGYRILDIFNNVSGGEWYLYSIKDNENYLMDGTIEKDIYPIKISPKITKKLKSGEIFEKIDTPYIIQMIPIENFEGEYTYYLKRVFNNSKLINLQKKYTRDSLIYSTFIAFGGMTLLWIIINYLLRPLTYLEKETRKFTSGTLDGTINIKSKSEIGFLADTMEKMRQTLKEREEKLKQLSFEDSLTKLYNRHYLEHLFKVYDDNNFYPITILVADLDGLKEVNDKQGHFKGDEYIKKSTKVMKRAIRKSDYLCRIGGDEFAFLLPNTCKKIASKVLLRVKEEIDSYNKNLKEEETPISVSIGIATCNDNCESLQKVMDLADKRMYKNKFKKKKKAKTI